MIQFSCPPLGHLTWRKPILMDAGQVVTAVGFLVSIFTILFGIVALMWQINSQSSRLEAKIEAQGQELRDEIREQGRYLDKKIERYGRRVSQAELDQARMNGVNSVILQQTHTHEATGDAD